MELKEFIETFLGDKFKLSPFQETLLKELENTKVFKPNLYSGYKYCKNHLYNQFTQARLRQFTKGQIFALASLDGVRVFEMTEFIPYDKEEE